MIDYGAKETDELYAKMEKRLNKVYRDANADMNRKLKKFMREYEADNKAKRKDLKAGKISETEYNNWLKSKAFQKKQLEEMVNTLAEDYTKTDLKAMGIVRGYMPEAYAINRNFGAFQVEKGSKLDTSFTLYDSHTVQRLVRDRPNLLPDPKPDIPKEMRWHKQKINHAITQGILQGESISDVAKRLQAVTDMDDRAALRNARTAMTAAQNAGRIDSYKDAQKLGIELKKEWLASLDGRTRDSHRDLDGVQVEVDKTFPNGCEYPGDPTGDPAEVYNCRCTLVPAIAGIDQSNAPRNSKLGDMSYEEWKQGKAMHAVPKPDSSRYNPGYSVSELKEPVRPKRAEFDKRADAYTPAWYDDWENARQTYREERAQFENALEEQINKAINVERFKSKDDVIAWAEGHGLILEDGLFEQIDLRAFNESSYVLDEMFKKYPEVKSFSLEDLDGSVFKTKFRIGYSDGTEQALMSANGGLNFSPECFRDYEEGIRRAFRSQMSGGVVMGDGTFGTFVRHEYGHNVQHYVELNMSNKYHMLVTDWRKNFNSFEEFQSARKAYRIEREAYKRELLELHSVSGASEYAFTNDLELFAEGFAAFTSGETTEFAIKFGKFLERWY